ncbi:MAG: hypothetical protein QM704_00070 [Anaeromyxobacteraceae bacterium]
MDLHDWVTANDPFLAARFVFVTGGAVHRALAGVPSERTQVACVEGPVRAGPPARGGAPRGAPGPGRRPAAAGPRAPEGGGSAWSGPSSSSVRRKPARAARRTGEVLQEVDEAGHAVVVGPDRVGAGGAVAALPRPPAPVLLAAEHAEGPLAAGRELEEVAVAERGGVALRARPGGGEQPGHLGGVAGTRRRAPAARYRRPRASSKPICP